MVHTGIVSRPYLDPVVAMGTYIHAQGIDMAACISCPCSRAMKSLANGSGCF